MNATASLGLNALHRILVAGRPLSAPEIAGAVGQRASRIRSILRRLQEVGILRSSRGHGYVLSRAPGEVTLDFLIRILQEPEAPHAPCGGDYEACESRASCILAHLCRRIHEAVLEEERRITLEDLRNMTPGIPNCIDPALRHAPTTPRN
jgi:DNA-binding IscR family transcriptional regulator